MSVIDYYPWGTLGTGTTGSINTSNTVTIDPSRFTDYKCGTCRKRYRRVDTSWSCCVAHSPGTCCHAFEQRITKKGYPKERPR